jgi:hypothetical protein
MIIEELNENNTTVNSIHKIAYFRALPVLCLIGLILCIVCLVVFLKSKLEETLNLFFSLKTFIQILLLIIGACLPFQSNKEYFSILFQLVILKFLQNSLHLMLTLIEVTIMIDRYFIIKSSAKIKVESKHKISILIIVLFSLIAFMPVLIKEKIVFNLNTQTYRLKKTDFGNSVYQALFTMLIDLFEILLIILVSIPLQIGVLNEYRKFIKTNKKSFTTITRIVHESVISIKKLTKEGITQQRCTRLILIISFLYTISRLIDSVCKIYSDIYQILMNDSTFFNIYFEILFILNQFYVFFIFSINIFIYYVLNRTFNSIFRSFFVKNCWYCFCLCKNK